MQELGEQAKSVFGITNAKGHWKFDEANSARITDNVRVGRYDAREMPFPDESFDAILSIATFEHVLDLDRALEEMYRVLRPGGILFTRFGPIWSCAVGHHIHMNIDEETYFRFWKEECNPIPNYYHLLYDEAELAELLADKHGEELAAKISHHVFHATHINRLMYADYYRMFAESKFEIQESRDVAIRDLPEPIEKKLVERYGEDGHYECGTIDVALKKPS